MRKKARIVLLIFWIIVIFALTGYPSLETPTIKDIPLDKLYHLVVFFVLGMLEYRVLKTYLFFSLGCSVAIFAELQQLVIPGRSFEILDIFFGIFGLLIAYFVFTKRQGVRNATSKT